MLSAKLRIAFFICGGYIPLPGADKHEKHHYEKHEDFLFRCWTQHFYGWTLCLY